MSAKHTTKDEAPRKSHLFLIFYLAFVALLCLVCIVGLGFVDNFLADYESSQPYKFVEKYIAMLADGDYSTAIALSGFVGTDFATAEECELKLTDEYKDHASEITYLRSSTWLGKDKVRYNLYIGEERVGYIILKKSGAETKYGFGLWKIEETNPFGFLDSYTVTVPEGYTLYADGTAIGQKYFTSENTVTEFGEFGNLASPKTETYTIDGFLFEPVFTVEPVSGEKYAVTTDESGHVLTYTRVAEHYDEIFSFTKTAVYQYIYTVSLGGETDSFLQYVLTGSDYAARFKKFNSDWKMYQPEFLSAEILNFSFTDYCEYTDKQITADIEFDYTVKTQYAEETYPAKYRIFFILTDSGWKIADMTNV